MRRSCVGAIVPSISLAGRTAWPLCVAGHGCENLEIIIVIMTLNTLIYTPFDKDLHEIVPEDLASLRGVSEGWYVEYKREVPNATSIAKSISAFSNTYGGWLFYGVEECSKEDPVAGDFPGIKAEDVAPALQRMRQAVAMQLNPSPHFESKVFWGPCASIGLSEGRAVICARVPWSPYAPHVHKNGVIYRRVADGSEPRPESERAALDQLWRRADDLRKRYKEWVEHAPELSEAEDNQPYVRLLLVADLWRDRDAWLDASIEEIRAIMSQPTGLVGSVPFDCVHTSSEGFLARHLMDNDPQNLGLTWRIRLNLDSEILFPLPFYRIDNPDLLEYEMYGYEGISRFAATLEKRSYSSARIVDLNWLFNLLIGIVETQRRLLAKASWTHGYFFKVQLLNFWRTTPFVDIPVVLDSFDAHGVPMCLDEKVTIPRGTGPDTFLEISNQDDINDEAARVYCQSMIMFAPIARAFGVPAWLDEGPGAEGLSYLHALHEAGRRAMDVQRLRNERNVRNR